MYYDSLIGNWTGATNHQGRGTGERLVFKDRVGCGKTLQNMSGRLARETPAPHTYIRFHHIAAGVPFPLLYSYIINQKGGNCHESRLDETKRYEKERR